MNREQRRGEHGSNALQRSHDAQTSAFWSRCCCCIVLRLRQERSRRRWSFTRRSIRNFRSRSSTTSRDETGIVVRPKFDTESTKTVGLTQAIIAERERPRCDLFWNNEILNTLRLERQACCGRTSRRRRPSFRPAMRSPNGMWYGFAARARVLDREHEPGCRRSGGRNRFATWPIRSGTSAAASPSRCSARRPRTRPACSPRGATTRPRSSFAT